MLFEASDGGSSSTLLAIMSSVLLVSAAETAEMDNIKTSIIKIKLIFLLNIKLTPFNICS